MMWMTACVNSRRGARRSPHQGNRKSTSDFFADNVQAVFELETIRLVRKLQVAEIELEIPLIDVTQYGQIGNQRLQSICIG